MTTVTARSGPPAPLRERLPGPVGAAGAWFRRSGIAAQILTLVIVVAVFAIGTGGKYLAWSNVQVILSLAAIPAIFAIGLHPTIVPGGIDLSVQGVASLCAVFVGLLLKNQFNSHDLGLWIVPICMLVGAVAGAVNGLLNAALKIPSFIASLGMDGSSTGWRSTWARRSTSSSSTPGSGTSSRRRSSASPRSPSSRPCSPSSCSWSRTAPGSDDTCTPSAATRSSPGRRGSRSA